MNDPSEQGVPFKAGLLVLLVIIAVGLAILLADALVSDDWGTLKKIGEWMVVSAVGAVIGYITGKKTQ